MDTSSKSNKVPSATEFTKSPLRNRIRVELNVPVAEVWELVGDLSRYPEYSFGLKLVESKKDASGKCTEYICHFKPMEEGGEGIAHREIMRWFEPGIGYALTAEEPNAFGLTNALTLASLEPSKEGTVMTWSQHYEAQDLT